MRRDDEVRKTPVYSKDVGIPSWFCLVATSSCSQPLLTSGNLPGETGYDTLVRALWITGYAAHLFYAV